jgi:hypothetical protein
MANKCMKKCSPSLAINKMQNKMTLRFNLTAARMAIIKNTDNNKCCQGCCEKGTLIHCWWECKLVQPLWKAVLRFLKKLETEVNYGTDANLWHIFKGI